MIVRGFRIDHCAAFKTRIQRPVAEFASTAQVAVKHRNLLSVSNRFFAVSELTDIIAETSGAVDVVSAI